MRDAVALPVTVKHRIGLDAVDDYAFVRDFVGTVADGRMRRVHRPCAQRGAERPVAEGKPRGAAAALRRRAPAEARLSRARRSCINGGTRRTGTRSSASSSSVDGVMLGRAAYHDPYCSRDGRLRVCSATTAPPRVARRDRRGAGALREAQLARGVPLRAIARTCSGSTTACPAAGGSANRCPTPRRLAAADASSAARRGVTRVGRAREIGIRHSFPGKIPESRL